MNARLFDDMTSVTHALVALSQLLELLEQNRLNAEEFALREGGIREITGIDALHPANRTTVIPVAESILLAAKAWMAKNSDAPALKHFAKILSGDAVETFNGTVEMSVGVDPKSAPTWYTQVLVVGRAMLEGNVDRKAQGEKIGALLRNIPVDAILGYVAQAFLKEALSPKPNRETLEKWWMYLTGRKPLHFQVHVQGLYAWPEVVNS